MQKKLLSSWVTLKCTVLQRTIIAGCSSEERRWEDRLRSACQPRLASISAAHIKRITRAG